MTESITFTSMNVQGLGNAEKRRDFLNYLKSKIIIYISFRTPIFQTKKLTIYVQCGVMTAILVT